MKYKAVGFDVDGTLVKNVCYCWQTFHERFGVSDKVRSILKRRYQEGRITYREWGSKEVAIWRELGVTRKDFTKVINSMRLTDGLAEALAVLRRTGHYLFILSGTIRMVLEQLLPNYDTLFDQVAVSDIHFDEEGRPVGFNPGHPLRNERENKLQELRSLCRELQMDISQVAFVGDNDNDAEVLRAAGLGIAFCPQSTSARAAADVVVDSPDLRNVLPHILGAKGAA
ncbi:MAG TPA: HAD-IB family phosphatase [bacterium]|nr:HAD-IB family phosphatase [bacterium]